MQEVLNTQVTAIYENESYMFPMSDLMIPGPVLDILELFASRSKTIHYMNNYDVFCDLAGIPRPTDKAAADLAWTTFFTMEPKNMPRELSLLYDWLDKGTCVAKLKTARYIRNIVHSSTDTPKVLECFFTKRLSEVDELAASVYKVFFVHARNYRYGACELAFLLMSKGYVHEMEATNILPDNFISVANNSHIRKWSCYDDCMDAYYAMIRFVTSPEYAHRFVATNASPSWRTKKRHRDVFYTTKELFDFFVEKAKEYGVQISTSKNLRRLWKHFFWRLLLHYPHGTAPSFIQFKEDLSEPECKDPSVLE